MITRVVMDFFLYFHTDIVLIYLLCGLLSRSSNHLQLVDIYGSVNIGVFFFMFALPDYLLMSFSPSYFSGVCSLTSLFAVNTCHLYSSFSSSFSFTSFFFLSLSLLLFLFCHLCSSFSFSSDSLSDLSS